MNLTVNIGKSKDCDRM